MTTSSSRPASTGAAALAVAAPVGSLLLAAAAAVTLAVHGALDRAVDPLSALLDPGATGAAVLLWAVLAAATAVSAGAGLVAGLGGTRGAAGARLVRVAWLGAGVTTVACVLEVVTGGLSRPVAAGQTLAAALVAVLLGSSWARAAAVPGLGLVGLLAVQLGPGRAGLPLALDALYAVGASVVVGAVLARSAPVEAPGPGERLVARLVLPSAVLAAAAGLAQLARTGPTAGYDVTHTAYGLAGLAQSLLPLLVTLTWPAAPRLRRLRAVAALLAVVAASVPAALSPPAAAAEAGRPLARPLELAGRHLAVLVAPLRPGPNLVHVAPSAPGVAEPTVAELAAAEQRHGGHHAAVQAPVVPDPATPAPDASGLRGRDAAADPHAGGHPSADGPVPPPALTVSAGGADIPLTTRSGATGLWAVLDIPAGTDRITLAEHSTDGILGGDVADVPVEVGDAPGDPELTAALTGPDGAECASALIGGLLAASSTGHPAAPPSSCPSQGLATGDADALRDTVALLAARGITGLTVAADDSARGAAAAELVRAEAAARDLPVRDGVPGDTLLVVSGWSQAPAALSRAEALAREVATGGVVLAPWLLNAPVLAAASSEVLASQFDPGDVAARRYGALVAAAFPGDGPSAAGHLAWLRAGGAGAPPAPRAAFYGAAPVDVPMGGMNHGSGSGKPGDWYPAGAVVAIHPPLGPAGATP